MKYLLLLVAIAAAIFLLAGCSSRNRSGDRSLEQALTDAARTEPGFHYAATTAEIQIASFSAGYADVAAERSYSAETPMYIYSLTKVFTALMVVQQVERGVIDLDAQVQSYLPWVPYAGTVRHYLSHSAGVPNPIWGTFYIHEAAAHERVDQDALLREIVAEHDASEFEPGTDVLYSNLGFAILGRVLEETTGASWHDLVAEYVTGPLGMDSTGIFPGDREGLSHSYVTQSLITRVLMGSAMPWIEFDREGAFKRVSPDYLFDFPAHGGLITTGHDIERFARAVLAEDSRLLGPEGWDQWLTPQSVASEEYALGWHVEQGTNGLELYHTGGALGNSAHLRVYLDRGIATFVQTNLLDSRKVVRRDRPELDAILLVDVAGR